MAAPPDSGNQRPSRNRRGYGKWRGGGNERRGRNHRRCGQTGGATSPLSELLAKTWISASGNVGNCINISTWYTFGADGSLTERDIDENGCSGSKLLNKFTGVWTLRDRVLEMTERAGPGDSVSGHVQAHGNGRQARRAVPDRHRHAGGPVAERGSRRDRRRRVHQAGTACRVQIDFSLALYDAASTVTDESDTFRITYDAVMRATEPGWMRVMPRPLDGLPNDQATAAWQTMEQQAGLSTNHSMRFASIFDRNFVYYLGYPTDNPHLLTQSLPSLGRWLEPTKPLPIQ